MARWRCGAAVLLGLAVLIALPFALPPFYVRVLQTFFFWAGLAASWNILGGFAGYWSFGHTAFIGIGGFTAGLISAKLMDGGGSLCELLLTVGAGGAAAAFFALIIAYPLLRLRGIYFAIAMLGVGEVITELTSNSDWIGGSLGMVLPPVSATLEPEIFFYYAFLGLLAVALAVATTVKRSRFGYGLASIREDEDTARMLGVPTELYKVQAFVLSAFMVGLSGSLYAYSLGYFTSASLFRIDFSLNMIVHSLIGGIGTLTGPIIGAGIMVVLTQVILGSLLNVHLLLTGGVVVLIVLLAPGGLVGLTERWLRREAEDDDISAPDHTVINEAAE